MIEHAQTRASRAARLAPLAAALVFVVALNLRPALTAVGPVLERIGRDEGLGEGLQGLLGALPLLAFAVVSPLVTAASRRIGVERAVLTALLVLALGTLIRSFAGPAGLWIGTVVIGAAIAVANVLVPVIVRRDYAGRVAGATGVYSACIGIGAAVASATAVPLQDVGGWPFALVFWAIPAVVAAALWSPRAVRPVSVRAADHERADAPARNVWRWPVAWVLTVFMGFQSTAFYVTVTWLPTIERSFGLASAQAGVELFVFQIVGIAGGLLIPRLLRRRDSQVLGAVASSVPMLVGVLGLLLLPAASLVWVIVAGVGSGASLVVALSLISLRGRSHDETARLSGMVQSVGYLLAAIGPVAAGALAQASGGWAASLGLLAAVAAAQIVLAAFAGRVPRDASEDQPGV